VLWTLGTGQNALLTAAVFGAATLLTERRPVLAGVLFGMLCYKPHFALLVPVAMLAGAHWRALLAAAASALGLVALSGVALGWHTWQAFLHAAAGARAVYGAGHIDVAGLASPYGAVLSLGGRPELASAVQAVAMLAAAGGVWLVWRRHASLPVRAAVLLAATPVAVPIVMFYDLMLSGLAMLWLVRAGRERGFLPWQQLAMVVLFLLPLRSGNLGASTQLLIAPVCAAGVLALALVCARAELSGARGMRRLPARSKQAIFTAEALRIFGCYAKRPKG
jgi:hypothetical protein